MLSPVRVAVIELTQPAASLPAGDDAYRSVQALVRWNRIPIGWARIPAYADEMDREALRRKILNELQAPLRRRVLENALASGELGAPMRTLLRGRRAQTGTPLPSISVAVCTRDRPDDLARCLQAIAELEGPLLEVLVVDNAPSTDANEAKVLEARSRFPHPLRYVREPRPGLDWARNTAIHEAKGDVIAFTDDDVVVDPDWAISLGAVFAENPHVAAVTGLVIPHELETDAQVLFELNGGFGRGFERKWIHFPRRGQMKWRDFATANLGTGANMSFRRTVFEEAGYFDPALDVGTTTQGAGDVDMFFRVLKSGLPLVYEPRAIVRHVHRRDYAELRRQLKNNGSVFAAFVRSSLAYPETAPGFALLGLNWFRVQLGGLLAGRTYRGRFPADLRIAQISGCLRGLTSYFTARRQAKALAASAPELPMFRDTASRAQERGASSDACAVRVFEVTNPAPIADVADFARTRVFVTWNQTLLGALDIVNNHNPISLMRLCDAIVQSLELKLICRGASDAAEIAPAHALAVAETDMFLGEATVPAPVPPAPATTPNRQSLSARTRVHDTSVSIVVATFDRPDDLRDCLRGLIAQDTPRRVEIIVVDNHPDSRRTAPVVDQFPGVKFVSEARQGVAYARNAGIAACSGDIIVTVDDDTIQPSDWLERLLAQFARPDVLAVTGNVLPRELMTVAQRHFESFGNGGLGRGFYRFEAGADWFERSSWHAVPTWELGGTANSAYRAHIFCDPAIGLMDEALGPGMPSGVGEDIYLFYKILKAGGVVCYEPTAYLWHKHRRDMRALRRQLYGYSKGFVCYHLTTLLNDRDYRALSILLVHLPWHHLGQVWRSCTGRTEYPLSLVTTEIFGNLAGPWALWRSRRRVRRMGRSAPCPAPPRPRKDAGASRLAPTHP